MRYFNSKRDCCIRSGRIIKAVLFLFRCLLFLGFLFVLGFFEQAKAFANPFVSDTLVSGLFVIFFGIVFVAKEFVRLATVGQQQRIVRAMAEALVQFRKGLLQIGLGFV